MIKIDILNQNRRSINSNGRNEIIKTLREISPQFAHNVKYPEYNFIFKY
jgi:hypothetical protein